MKVWKETKHSLTLVFNDEGFIFFSNFFVEKIIIAAEIADWEVCVT